MKQHDASPNQPMLMMHKLPIWQDFHSRCQGLDLGKTAWTCSSLPTVTGGSATQDQAMKPIATGSSTHASASSTGNVATQGFAVELQFIRDTLRLSAAELAQVFGVSRPTIFSWQNGTTVSTENARRLREIVQALNLHKDIIKPEGGRVAHRAVEGRTTLLQMLAKGASAQDAIYRLADILVREAAERERLARRLQDRTGNLGEADVDTLG